MKLNVENPDTPGVEVADRVDFEQIECDVAVQDFEESARDGRILSEVLNAGMRHMDALSEAAYHLTPEAITTPVNLTPPAFEALDLAVERLGRLAGAKPQQFAFERHANTSPVQLAQVAFESIGASLKALWDKIISGLKRVWEWFKTFLTNLTNACKGLGARATKLEQALGQFDGMKHGGDVKYYVGGHSERFHRFFADTPSDDALVHNYQEQCSFMSNLQHGVQQYMTNAEQVLKRMVIDYRVLAVEYPEQIGTAMQTLFGKEVGPVFSDPDFYRQLPNCRPTGAHQHLKNKHNHEATAMYVKPLWFSGAFFYGIILDDSWDVNAQARALRHCGFGVDYAIGQASRESLAIPPLDKARQLCKMVNIRMDQLSKASDDAKAVSALLTELVRYGQSTPMDKGPIEGRQQFMQMVMNGAALMSKMLSQGERSLRQYEVTCARHLLDFIGQAAKTHYVKSAA